MSGTDSTKRSAFSFRCPLPLYRRMEKHAATMHMDISEFVFAALRHALGSSEALNKALSSTAPNPPHRSTD